MFLEKGIALARQHEKRLIVRPDPSIQNVQTRAADLAEQMAGPTIAVKKGHNCVTIDAT